MKRKLTTGYTLIEFLIAVFIFAAVAAGASLFAVYYFKSYSFSFDEHQLVSQAQGGINTMIREIREIRNADNGAWPIVDAQDNQFVFYSDVTNDGRTDRVRYYLNGTILNKGIIEPTLVPVTYPPANEVIRFVASHVDTGSGPLFMYYNGSWPSDTVSNPLSQTERQLNTRFVTINLRVNLALDTSSTTQTQPFQLTSGVQIRSMKDNL